MSNCSKRLMGENLYSQDYEKKLYHHDRNKDKVNKRYHEAQEHFIERTYDGRQIRRKTKMLCKCHEKCTLNQYFEKLMKIRREFILEADTLMKMFKDEYFTFKDEYFLEDISMKTEKIKDEFSFGNLMKIRGIQRDEMQRNFQPLAECLDSSDKQEKSEESLCKTLKNSLEITSNENKTKGMAKRISSFPEKSNVTIQDELCEKETLGAYSIQYLQDTAQPRKSFKIFENGGHKERFGPEISLPGNRFDYTPECSSEMDDIFSKLMSLHEKDEHSHVSVDGTRREKNIKVYKKQQNETDDGDFCFGDYIAKLEEIARRENLKEKKKVSKIKKYFDFHDYIKKLLYLKENFSKS